MISENIKEKLESIPKCPGVYKFLDSNSNILYIGKATNLYSRVNSYFSSNLIERPRILQMLPFVSDIEYIQTDNDIEALVLESALIKSHQPKYNSALKDDKSYSYIYINHKDRYPTLKIVRNVSKSELNKGKLFGPYPHGRTVKRVFNYLRRIFPFCTSKDPSKPCFYMHLGLCPGPDNELVYRENIKGIISFLEGRNNQLISSLERQMNDYSKSLEYEKAAIIRDKINDLKYLTSSINIDSESFEQNFNELRMKNFEKMYFDISKQTGVKNIRRIECYDISNLSGKNAYGSMTVLVNGNLEPSLYRIFKIKSGDEPNDVKMIREVVFRRLENINKDVDVSLSQRPDLILIDGGKTQLSGLKGHKLLNIPIFGITKGRRYKRKGGKLLDEFWVEKNNEIVKIKIRNSKPLSLLRDEAHRFALKHHRKNKVQTQVKSFYDEIPLIGPKSKKLLKKVYSSKIELVKASFEDLNKILKNKRIVNSILQYFKEKA